MNDEMDNDPDDELDDGSDDAEEAPKTSKKKLIIIGVGALVSLLAIGGGAAFWLGLFSSGGEHEQTELQAEITPAVRHELPPIKADLKTGKCRSPFVKATVVVEVDPHDLELLALMDLRIIDRVRDVLRERERQDMVGRKGADLLRADIAEAINKVIAPAKVRTVLFKQLLVQ